LHTFNNGFEHGQQHEHHRQQQTPVEVRIEMEVAELKAREEELRRYHTSAPTSRDYERSDSSNSRISELSPMTQQYSPQPTHIGDRFDPMQRRDDGATTVRSYNDDYFEVSLVNRHE